jgi:two-component system CheB/CheR fusion protein
MIWMNNENFILTDPTTKDMSIYSVGTDITEVVNAKEIAEEALGQLLLLQELAGVGYWTVNLETGKLHWSEEVFRIHGKDHDAYRPDLTEAINFYHPEDRDEVRASIDKVTRDGGDFHFTKRIVTEDGITRNVEAFGLGRAHEDGKIRKIIGVFREIKGS